MTDPRIAIVEGWYCARLSRGPGHRTPEQLLSKLDSARPEPTGDEVERVARAMYEQHVAECLEGEETREGERHPLLTGYWMAGWDNEYARICHMWRRRARAAIAAIPPSGALGLARELLVAVAAIPPYDNANEYMAACEKAEALVAMLGGEK